MLYIDRSILSIIINEDHCHSLYRRENSFSSNAKRPFAPRSPSDVTVGNVVKFLRQGGKISKGQVKYIGRLPAKHDIYLGVELEHERQC